MLSRHWRKLFCNDAEWCKQSVKINNALVPAATVEGKNSVGIKIEAEAALGDSIPNKNTVKMYIYIHSSCCIGLRSPVIFREQKNARKCYLYHRSRRRGEWADKRRSMRLRTYLVAWCPSTFRETRLAKLFVGEQGVLYCVLDDTDDTAQQYNSPLDRNSLFQIPMSGIVIIGGAID